MNFFKRKTPDASLDLEHVNDVYGEEPPPPDPAPPLLEAVGLASPAPAAMGAVSELLAAVPPPPPPPPPNSELPDPVWAVPEASEAEAAPEVFEPGAASTRPLTPSTEPDADTAGPFPADEFFVGLEAAAVSEPLESVLVEPSAQTLHSLRDRLYALANEARAEADALVLAHHVPSGSPASDIWATPTDPGAPDLWADLTPLPEVQDLATDPTYDDTPDDDAFAQFMAGVDPNRGFEL